MRYKNIVSSQAQNTQQSKKSYVHDHRFIGSLLSNASIHLMKELKFKLGPTFNIVLNKTTLFLLAIVFMMVFIMSMGLRKPVVSFYRGLSLNEQPPGLPMQVSDSVIKPLVTLIDPQLQRDLDQIIGANKVWSSLVAQKKMCIGLVDLRDAYNVKFARINGNEMMYAASLPKIAVLLAATESINDGSLEETSEVKSDMRIMIAKSDNAATTRMIDRVGLDKIAEVMQNPKYEFYDEDNGGGLWVGKRYAKTGPRKGDPLKNISHGATATQVCRYYYLLAFGKLVNYERSKQMLGYLGDPMLHHKFVNTLDKVAPRAQVFRKSGSWRTYHSDSVLVWGPTWRRYILVALVDDPDGENIMRNLIMDVDNRLKPKQ
ncbi:MAG: serine hydrolase [Cyclobacteriaceae bacterium]